MIWDLPISDKESAIVVVENKWMLISLSEAWTHSWLSHSTAQQVWSQTHCDLFSSRASLTGAKLYRLVTEAQRCEPNAVNLLSTTAQKQSQAHRQYIVSLQCGECRVAR